MSTSMTRSARAATQPDATGAGETRVAATGRSFSPEDLRRASRQPRGDTREAAPRQFGLLSLMSRAVRRGRRAFSAVLFGTEAVQMLERRDIDAYLRTTEG